MFPHTGKDIFYVQNQENCMNESCPPGFSELFDSDVNDTKIGIISTQKKIGIFEVTEKNILHLLAWSFGIFLFFYKKGRTQCRRLPALRGVWGRVVFKPQALPTQMCRD